ncbi:MAG: hypothetical protein MJ252_04100 [archaeon]|nr:hypothetical protein [archaeon]
MSYYYAALTESQKDTSYSTNNYIGQNNGKNKIFNELMNNLNLNKSEIKKNYTMNKKDFDKSLLVLQNPLFKRNTSQHKEQKLKRNVLNLEFQLKKDSNEMKRSYRNRPMTDLKHLVSCKLNIKEQLKPYPSSACGLITSPIIKAVRPKRNLEKKTIEQFNTTGKVDIYKRQMEIDQQKNRKEFNEFFNDFLKRSILRNKKTKNTHFKNF